MELNVRSLRMIAIGWCSLAFLLFPLATPVVQSAPARATSDWVVESRVSTSEDLNSIAFANELDGYIVGSHGIMFATHDGGLTWGTYVTSTDDNLSRVQFFDPVTGYVIGDSTILVTTDGGHSWNRIPLPDGMGPIYDIANPAPDRLYLFAGYNGTTAILVSTDRGKTWQQLFDAGYVASIQRIKFSSPMEGWAYGTDQYGNYDIERTTDGGLNWQNVDLHASPVGMWFFPPVVFALLNDTQGGFIDLSTDDGGSFSRLTLPIPGGDLRVMTFFSAQSGILATTTGPIYVTQNGGVTWAAQTLPPVGLISLVASFVGRRGNMLFAMTSDGQFLHNGPLPVTPTTTATGTPIPSNTPTVPAFIAFPTNTPAPPVPTPLPSLLKLTSISPSTVVAGSNTLLTLRGNGFDSLVTVSIGDRDFTDVTINSGGNITLRLPSGFPSGVYDVTLTEPDGSTSTLVHGLTVFSHPMVAGHFLHRSVPQGGTAILSVQAPIGALVSVRVETGNGHPLPHFGATLQADAKGQWRILIPIGSRVAPGKYLVLVLAKLGQAQAQIALSVVVTAAGHELKKSS